MTLCRRNGLLHSDCCLRQLAVSVYLQLPAPWPLWKSLCLKLIICNSYRQFRKYPFHSYFFSFSLTTNFVSLRYTQLGLQTALISSIQACQHNYTCTFPFVQLLFMYIQIFVHSSLIKILVCVCMHACVCVCVHVCVRACVHVYYRETEREETIKKDKVRERVRGMALSWLCVSNMVCTVCNSWSMWALL